MFHFSEMIYVCRSLSSVRFFSGATDLAYTSVFKLHLVSVQWPRNQIVHLLGWLQCTNCAF